MNSFKTVKVLAVLAALAATAGKSEAFHSFGNRFASAAPAKHQAHPSFLGGNQANQRGFRR